MKLDAFFKKFDQFADAPDAVAKMRELVLELAIQGKLVAQDGTDEPARKQLERIAAKKLKTGRVARVKARAGASSATEDIETYVPDGWENTSLAALVTVLNGRAYSKDELLEAGTPVLRVGNLFTSKHWYYSDLELELDKYCDTGDLIFAWSASFGPFIWPGPKVIYHYHIWKLELHSEADLHKGYLYWFLQNKTQEIRRAGHGVSMLHMTKEKMEKLEVVLPPLAEQKRIVAKVDELMALCDRLEAQQQERETRHAALARASLARFADAPTPANLNFLFHPSYDISPADLRKSILTLAVQGKLVPHATEFANWKTRKLKYLTTKIGSGSTPPGGKESYQEAGVPFIRSMNVHFGGFVRHGLAFLSDEQAEKLKNVRVEADDVLLNITGASIGRVATAPKDMEGARVNQHVCILRPTAEIISQFLELFLASPVVQNLIDDVQVGATRQALTKAMIEQFEIPVPSIAEQRQIVAKVEQLMALVDELETQLTDSHATAKDLLSALIAELTT